LAAAPAPSGLDIKVRASDPLKPVVVLTNNSGKPCQVANTALGTIAVTSASQDGKAITPIPVDVGFLDRLDSLLAERLQTLAAGKSAEINIPVVKAGPTGQALEVVTWSDSGPFGSLFPIAKDMPLTLEVGYSVPLPPDEKTPLCAPGFSSGSLGGNASDDRPKWMRWAAIGAVVLLLLLVVVFLLMRRKKTAAAAVLFLLAGGGVLAHAKPALAVFDVDDSLQSAFDNCMAVFREHGPAHFLD